MPEFALVEKPGSIIPDIRGLPHIGVDTEFMREKTYFAELCLVQIATGTMIYCVDPLTDSDIEPFWHALMANRWIVHSARQDIEVLYQAAGCMPSRLFDTQIAAGLIGMTPQLGYATLVRELLGVDIAKSHTRANWLRRPLSPALLEYAAEDVEHLLPVCDILENRLEDLGRLAWAEEDSVALLDPGLYGVEPRHAISRLKGARNLRGHERDAAARIAAWRESRAARKNLPRQWVLRDRSIVELARRRPQSVADLADVDGLGAGTIRRHGRQLLRLVAESAKAEVAAPAPAPTAAQRQLAKLLQQRVANRAAELGIAAEIIAGRKEIASAIQHRNYEARLFSGWRCDVVGDELRGLLESG